MMIVVHVLKCYAKNDSDILEKCANFEFNT